MTDDRERGLALFREIYGDETAEGLAAYMETDAFGVECARWSTDFCFGQVWTREALDRKLRSCVVLGMMIALRQSDEIRYHTRMGMANGLDKGEIEEILYTSVPYCGLPASNIARAAMQEAFAQMESPASRQRS
jgi:alkylhydroperoxidase/carboxymuconolactone decarboxylase family protein YurZ